MKKILTFLLLLLASSWAYGQEAVVPNDNSFNSVAFRSLPPLAVSGEEGISAPFAGVVGGNLWVAGGCNFPEIPAADGGRKVFYKDIFELSATSEGQASWHKVGELPSAVAYGASVSVPDGLLCMGGTDGERSLARVYLLTKGATNALEIKELSPLPVALDNFTAAFGGGFVYVAGGQSDGKPSQAAFRMDYSKSKTWERLPDVPGSGRLQPASAVQNNALGPCFYLMGGYNPPCGSELAEIHTDGLVYDPKKGAWSSVAPIIPYGRKEAMALVGASGLPSGCAHIVFAGGVNKEVFETALNRSAAIAQISELASMAGLVENAAVLLELKAEQTAYMKQPAENFRFNSELLIYHTLTDTWVTESQSPLLARAGAGFVSFGGEWVVIDGELKPGVRASDVTGIKMSVRPNFGVLNWSVLVLYLLGMIALGYYFMRREVGAEDFFKGGGRIPWWAAGISIYATMLSAITYMAYPAKAFATDWTYYPMLMTILVVSFPVVKYFLPFFRRLNVTTAYEYLEHRFNAATRLMASALFIVFMIARMALVLYLPSLALTAVTGINIYACIILMSLVTIVYCTMGGVEAVVWGDVIQGFILVGGAIFAVVYLVGHTDGGFSNFIALGSEGGKFRLFDWSMDYRSATFWVIILGGLANNLISYTSDQTVIQRYLTTKDERSARHSILMNGVMSVFVSVVFFAIGTGLYTFFKTHPADLDFTMAKSDAIFPFFMMSRLPQGIAGLLIAAIFAATMSTISSNINSVATAFSVDFYKRLFPGAGDRSTLRVARRCCIVAGALGMCIALLMATWEILSILDFFQEILGLLSSGLGGLFLMGIFVPRIGGRAALTGFVAGVAAVFAVRGCTEVSFLLYGFIGMAVSLVVGLIFSYIFVESKDLRGLTWRQLRREGSESLKE